MALKRGVERFSSLIILRTAYRRFLDWERVRPGSDHVSAFQVTWPQDVYKHIDLHLVTGRLLLDKLEIWTLNSDPSDFFEKSALAKDKKG